MKRFQIIWMLVLSIGAFSKVYAGNEVTCPRGSYQVLHNVCVADGLESTAVMASAGPGECHLSSHVNPATLDFCMLKGKTSLTAIEGGYFVDIAPAKSCDRGYIWWSQYEICRDENLVIGLVDDKAVLLIPRQECSPDSRVCAPVIEQGTGCPEKYSKPDNEEICFEDPIVFKTSKERNYGVTPIGGDCGEASAAEEGRFCTPVKTVFVCGPNTFSCGDGPNGQLIVVEGGPSCCPEDSRAGIVYTPVYGNDGFNLTLEPKVLCAPAHGQNWMCVDEPELPISAKE